MVAVRPTRCIGVDRFGPCALRDHEIAVAGTWVDPELRMAARPLIEAFARELPGAPGFVVYHRARPANFVLAHLWDGLDLVQRCWTSPLHDPAAVSAHRPGAIGCVWELEIVARERDAWARVCDTPSAAETYLSSPRPAS
ncbi:hypothetical protein [Arsenicicoccus dermatophilus]|uniref:hypothetical protein n=1 Tax=Arsenicicoccus dermatophilus TaxID=1076331 RepID=UPI001F4C8A24|nr:hypothetical protein [Arsenicicoccus dermatophilus]MCH8611847.1 hypothetical protein [Arsenicicoccus dermatophilus]